MSSFSSGLLCGIFDQPRRDRVGQFLLQDLAEDKVHRYRIWRLLSALFWVVALSFHFFLTLPSHHGLSHHTPFRVYLFTALQRLTSWLLLTCPLHWSTESSRIAKAITERNPVSKTQKRKSKTMMCYSHSLRILLSVNVYDFFLLSGFIVYIVYTMYSHSFVDFEEHRYLNFILRHFRY